MLRRMGMETRTWPARASAALREARPQPSLKAFSERRILAALVSFVRIIGGRHNMPRINYLRLSAALMALAAAVAIAGDAALAAPFVDTRGNAGAVTATDAALDQALRRLVAMPGGPAGAIAVVQRGEERKVHRFGTGDLSDNEPLRINDHMRVASIAKAFSGAAALSLVSKGDLSLSDTIGERLPDLPKAWSRVTLRQLLGHTSGLPDFSKATSFQSAVRASPTKAPSPRELLAFVKNQPLQFPPGSQYKYSNSDNIAVALMVQAETKNTYSRELKNQIYGPLGLASTSLPAGPELPEPFIHGYDQDDPALYPPEDLSEIIAAGWSWASGGVVSSPADLNAFIRGYVGGRLFDPNTQAQQRVVVEGAESEPPGPGKNAAGLGIFRYRTRCGTVWGHTGNTPGYTQFAAASPDGRRSVTVSVNVQLSLSQGAPSVLDALRDAEERAVCAGLADF
jgi:D-alanyl-D-alanine carboxypeptidase